MMLAPVTIVQRNGKRIHFDAWDVCNVVEQAVGVEVTYMPTDKPDIFVTDMDFDAVVTCLQVAREREPTRKHRDGDEWKKGYDDHED